jgi:hypothetical protein
MPVEDERRQGQASLRWPMGLINVLSFFFLSKGQGAYRLSEGTLLFTYLVFMAGEEGRGG